MHETHEFQLPTLLVSDLRRNTSGSMQRMRDSNRVQKQTNQFCYCNAATIEKPAFAGLYAAMTCICALTLN